MTTSGLWRPAGVTLVSLACFACTNLQSEPQDQQATLVLPTDPTQITIAQRTADPVPGSRDLIHLDIGDVTGGQVLTTLTLDDHDPLVPRRSMEVGDIVEFTVDGRRLSLGLARLINRLLSEDHAVFYIGTAEAVATAQINDLLKRIETSKYTFVRFGEEQSGKVMAGHLRRRWKTMSDEIHTAGDFIDRVAADASTTSKPYKVRVGSVTLPLAEWLRGR